MVTYWLIVYYVIAKLHRRGVSGDPRRSRALYCLILLVVQSKPFN